MTLDPMYDTDVGERSSHASIRPYRQGVPVLTYGGIVVPLDKIDDAVLYLKHQRGIDMIQVYIAKNVLLDTFEFKDGNKNYMWDDLMITHSATASGIWRATRSDMLLQSCPGAVSSKDRVERYRVQLQEQEEEKERQKENFLRALPLIYPGREPPKEDPN